MKLYAMEAGFLSRLISDRKELLSFARDLGTAEAMRAAREDLMASVPIQLSPGHGRKPDDPLYTVDPDGAAHIDIVGEMTPHAETDACGAYTAEALTEYGYISAAIKKAEADPEVKSLAFYINSPGGYVDGLDQVLQDVSSATKKTVSYVDNLAASAAFVFAANTDVIVATSPFAKFGSVGVATEEFNKDEALAKQGIVHRIYTSTDAPDKRPDTNTPEGRAKVVALLDETHAVLVRRVAEGRHVTEEKVSKDFGRGGVLIAEKALASGMIDAVEGAHITRNSAVVDGSAAAEAATKDKEVLMDLAQLKAEHPDIYQAAKAEGYGEGKTAGIEKERARVAKLHEFRGLSSKADQIIEEAVASGAEYDDLAPKITAATMRLTEADNAPDVATVVQEKPAGANALTEQDYKAMKLVHMTEEEYRKYSEGGN